MTAYIFSDLRHWCVLCVSQITHRNVCVLVWCHFHLTQNTFIISDKILWISMSHMTSFKRRKNNKTCDETFFLHWKCLPFRLCLLRTATNVFNCFQFMKTALSKKKVYDSFWFEIWREKKQDILVIGVQSNEIVLKNRMPNLPMIINVKCVTHWLRRHDFFLLCLKNEYYLLVTIWSTFDKTCFFSHIKFVLLKLDAVSLLNRTLNHSRALTKKKSESNS